MVVDARDPRALELRVLVGDLGQRPDHRALEQFEPGTTAALELLERLVVQDLQQRRDRRVHLGQAKEAPIAQPRQDPAADQQHAGFHGRLVARLSGARRQHRAAVMLGHRLVGPVRLGFVAVGLGDQRPRVVGHQQRRGAAEVLERRHVRADPVGLPLRGRGARKRVVRRAPHRNEHARRPDLAGGRVDHPHRLAGVVHEQLLARLVLLAHRAAQRRGERRVQLAEARAAVRQQPRLAAVSVLLPQQLQRHALAAQLPVHVGQCRHRVAAAHVTLRVQPREQRRVVELARERRGDPGRLRRRHVVGHRALGDAQRPGNRLVRQPALVLQPKHFSYSMHGHPLGRHAWLLSQCKKSQRSQPAFHESPPIAPAAADRLVDVLTALSTILTGSSTNPRNRSELFDVAGHHRRHAGQNFSSTPVNLRRHTQLVRPARQREFPGASRGSRSRRQIVAHAPVSTGPPSSMIVVVSTYPIRGIIAPAISRPIGSV